MITTRSRSTKFIRFWSLPCASAIVAAVGVGVAATAPPADAQPPGTLCGHI